MASAARSIPHDVNGDDVKAFLNDRGYGSGNDGAITRRDAVRMGVNGAAAATRAADKYHAGPKPLTFAAKHIAASADKHWG